MIKIKNRILFTSLFIVLCIICINLDNSNTIEPNVETNEYGYKDIEVQGNSITYNYKDLKEEAKLIVLIECLDDITKLNSNIYYEGDFLVGFSSNRKVRILESYKGNYSINDELSILEPVGVTDENEMLYMDDYRPLKKGDKYILFLSDNNMTQELSVISGNNGKIQLEDFENNDYMDIALKTIAEFESDLNNDEKEEIINSEIKTKENISTTGRKRINTDIVNSELIYEKGNGALFFNVNYH